jgi:integrase
MLQETKQKYKDGETINVDEIIQYFIDKPIKDSSKVSQLSAFKRELKNIRYTPELELLKMPRRIAEKVLTEQRKRRDAKHENVLIIHNSKKIIADILQGITSKNFDKLYPALLLASGRRSIEVYMMKPVNTDDNTSTTFLFRNQLKKRNQNHNDYIIELLIPVKEFNKGLKNLQELVRVNTQTKTPAELSKLFRKANANAMLKLSSRLGISLKASDLRRIYVAELFRRSNSNKSFNAWIKTYLGHDHLETSLNYSTLLLR